jgi:hypothetical protein
VLDNAGQLVAVRWLPISTVLARVLLQFRV